MSSKRVAILINGPSAQRQRTNDAVGVVVLSDEEMRCGICGEDYFFDTDSADEDAKKTFARDQLVRSHVLPWMHSEVAGSPR